VLIGVLPGLGGANGVAILLPLTFQHEPDLGHHHAELHLLGCAVRRGDHVHPVQHPGEPWSVATTFDGYPMAQQGRAGEALTAAFTSSFVGAFSPCWLITFLAPLLAKFALKFGPPEFFAVQMLTFCSFIGMSKDRPMKTLAAMMLGFALAAVGHGHGDRQLRMTFGVPGTAQGLRLPDRGDRPVRHRRDPADHGRGPGLQGQVGQDQLPSIVWQTWKELLNTGSTFIRSVAGRLLDGHHPGGATPASFMSYGMARRAAKDKESFGKGNIEGVVAPETAAHAAGTSALLPMLTLGIPGSPTAAVLLGGLLIWGLQPGPLLFVEQKDFVWGLIASMYLGNMVGLIVVLTTVPWWAAILRIPFSVIAPVIIVICAIGAYTVHSSMFDVILMLVFGVLGYLFKKLATRWRRWCWPWCWATWPNPASASRCCRSRAWPFRQSRCISSRPRAAIAPMAKPSNRLTRMTDGWSTKVNSAWSLASAARTQTLRLRPMRSLASPASMT
jgi:putative tricarboxylic transport membrane protein